MRHCLNLNRVAERVKTDRMTQRTFYLNLINAFKGADVLTVKEIDDVINVVQEDTKVTIAHLQSLKKRRLKIAKEMAEIKEVK